MVLSSAELTRKRRFYHGFLLDLQTFHEPSEFLPGDGTALFFRSGPLELTTFQPLIQKDETVTFPQQCFQTVIVFSAEQKQRWGERIQLKLLLDDSCQAVDGLSHVGITGCDINMFRNGDVA